MKLKKKKPLIDLGPITIPRNNFWLPILFGDDEVWDWFVAVVSVDMKDDPGPLIQLLAQGRVPGRAMPFVEDLLNRKLGKEKSKPGPKMLLWDPPPLEGASLLVGELINNDGLSVETAVDQFLEEYSMFSGFSGVTRDQLIAHYTSKSGFGRRWQEKRAIRTVRGDPASSRQPA
jgi:hypothetical protein